MSEGNVRPCGGCGASIYSEHIEAGIAGYAKGKLLCPHCLAEATGESQRAATQKVAMTGGGISLASGTETEVHAATAIRNHAGESQAASLQESTKFKRPLMPHGSGATRCRTFHAKLNDAAIAFMNDHINEWIDAHPDVTVKFAASTIGVFEGKHAEPNLVVTVFY